MVGPARRREAVAKTHATIEVSERRACQVLGQPRSTQRYHPCDPDRDRALVKRMHELVRHHPRYGYRWAWALLRADGWRVNRKRIHRLWRKEGLKVVQRQRKRRRLGHSGNGVVRHRAEHMNHVWCYDFVKDQTTDGRPLKFLPIEDEYTRECLALEVDRSITAKDVVEVLAYLFEVRGAPKFIRSDNGPEFIARAIRDWLKASGVETLYIEPGSPWQNAYSESFNSRFLDELLNGELFTCLTEARVLSGDYKLNYNHRRPHSSLGYQTPAVFAAKCKEHKPLGAPPPNPRLLSPPRCAERQKLKGVELAQTLIATGT